VTAKNGRGGASKITMRRLAAFALVFPLISCAVSEPSPPRAPSVVHIPIGWIGAHTKAGPRVEATPKTTTEANDVTEEETPATDDAADDDAIQIVPLDTGKPRSSLLPSGFANPLPGGFFSGYAGDTGLDVASPPHEVYAIAAGTLDYSEDGHTLWMGKNDTHFSVRIALDAPVAWKSHQITHVYYTHLSAIEVEQHEGAKLRHHVEAGDAIGTSGVANGMPHLHLGLLLDGHVEQDDWTYILRESEIRAVLGKWANGAHLPAG